MTSSIADSCGSWSPGPRATARCLARSVRPNRPVEQPQPTHPAEHDGPVACPDPRC
jgi:hypothetical protein